MPFINPKYDRLSLIDAYLTDPLLLALAWKKAHEYIRSINWYADNFELDKSALNLAKLCREWSVELETGPAFSPLHLVPAPKGAKWVFVQNTPDTSVEAVRKTLDSSWDGIPDKCYRLNWEPQDKDKIKLRPLAHSGIKEQTFMTLVMMCLANDVETLQGDPATAYKDVHDKKVVSYGNRLYCTYLEDGTAEYNYGATTTYGKFFTDYRKFLQRPYHFAAKALPEKSPDEEVYLVDLDLTQFFDFVDRQKLVSKIKGIAHTEALSVNAYTLIEKLFKAFENWEWSADAIKNYPICATKEVPNPPSGLPQGLVASGFLSNIYMLDFDAYMSEFIGKKIPQADGEPELKLVDYCRYVDDMRLVILGPSRSKSEGKNPIPIIQNALNKWLEVQLNKFNLQLNTDKTKVEIYRGKSRGISVVLEDIQIRGSGPVPHEEAEELISQLESLLMLSGGEILDQQQENPKNGHCQINRLALIEKSVFDVREDTLKRFAANKIARLLNNIRHFTSRDADERGNPVAGDWDYLQERMARRLIACWSHDPALVLLLKKGLELFPSPKLLEPVVEQLEHVLTKLYSTDAQLQKQGAVARYCLAEVFRHSAMVIYRKDSQAIPAHADIDAYFEYLQDFAAKLLKPAISTKTKPDDEVHQPKFDLLLDQARLLLMTRLDSVLEHSTGNDDQDLIFKLAKGFRNIEIKKSADVQNIATCILISSQLVADQKPVIRSVSCLLDSVSYPVQPEDILKKIALQDPLLLKAIILHARPLSYGWKSESFIKDLTDKLYIFIKPSAN